MGGRVAAKQAEYARPAQQRIQVWLSGHDMEVNMPEAFCLGEQRNVGLGGAKRLAQRRGESTQQRAELSGFFGGQLVQRGYVPPRQHDQRRDDKQRRRNRENTLRARWRPG